MNYKLIFGIDITIISAFIAAGHYCFDTLLKDRAFGTFEDFGYLKDENELKQVGLSVCRLLVKNCFSKSFIVVMQTHSEHGIRSSHWVRKPHIFICEFQMLWCSSHRWEGWPARLHSLCLKIRWANVFRSQRDTRLF